MTDMSQVRGEILKRYHLPVNSIATCVFQIARFGREEAVANPLANEQDAERFLVKGVFGGQECLFPHSILIEGGSFSVRNYSFLFFSRPRYPS